MLRVYWLHLSDIALRGEWSAGYSLSKKRKSAHILSNQSSQLPALMTASTDEHAHKRFWVFLYIDYNERLHHVHNLWQMSTNNTTAA